MPPVEAKLTDQQELEVARSLNDQFKHLKDDELAWASELDIPWQGGIDGKKLNELVNILATYVRSDPDSSIVKNYEDLVPPSPEARYPSALLFLILTYKLY